jgi:hypothetical protein
VNADTAAGAAAADGGGLREVVTLLGQAVQILGRIEEDPGLV